MESHCAFLVQKSIYEHSRYTAAAWRQLFKEEDFKRAVDLARWGNFPIGLGHVCEMVLSVFQRQRIGDPAVIAAGLAQCAVDIFARYPAPAGYPSTFWSDSGKDVSARLQRAAACEPRRVMDMPGERGREFFDRLPIHERLRGRDPGYVLNNLKGNLVQAHETFLQRADLAALADALSR